MARVAGAVGVSVLLASAEAGPSGGAMQKVIDMLADMSAKVTQEKNDEQVAFAKFSEWCKQETTNYKSEIEKDGQEIEMLTTSIDDLSSKAKTLGEEIGELEGAVTKHEADKEAEVSQRKKDHAEFLEEEKDYSESVDALERALATLNKEDYDRPAAAAALVQLSDSNRLPARAKAIVSAFVDMFSEDKDQQEPGLGGTDYSAPEANAYEFQSGGIVDLLKKLQDEFRGKLGEVQKEEMNAKHASDMIVQDLTDSISNANKDISEKKAQKGEAEETAANNKKQLAATKDVKAQSEKTLEDVTTECSEKKLSFEEKQQLRTEEIEAIAKATEILSSPDVAGQHEKHLQLLQTSQGSSALAQLRSTMGNPRRKVREFLATEGQRLKSKQLGLLAEKIGADPFAKVKKMIDGMITRLLEEANADANQEGFCDKEMGKSKITRTKLTEDIDSLAAAIDEGKATILHRTNRIAELTKEVSELETAMTEAADMRVAEKAKNEQTIEEAKVAQEKVQAATAVLKDFYARAAGTTAFVQTQGKAKAQAGGIKMGSDLWNSLANPDFQGAGGFATGIESSKVDKGHKEGMQTFGEAYKGNQAAGGGVIALLEVVLSDFAGLEADTSAAEAAAAKAHEEFVIASKKDKAVKEKQIEMDTADKTAAEARLQEDTAEWKGTQDELLAAERYHEKLVPQCVDKGMTYEERTAAREEEIKSLKQALEILGSEDIETSA